MKKYAAKALLACLWICSFPFVTSAQETKKIEFTLQVNDSIKLAGELEYPNKPGKFPAAILIWGSGPHTRNQEISGSPMFKQMADSLVKEGMAVLRMDKRGVGKSTGVPESEGNYTTRDLANDIRLAYAFLNKQPFVDSTKIGLIGHSEGSIIAAMLGAEEAGLDWIIVLGPPAVPGDFITAEQTRQNRMKLGMSKEVSAAIGKVWEKYFRFIKEGYKSDSIYYALGREFLIAHGLDKDDKRITNKFIDQLLGGYKTPWNQYFFNTDPSQFLQNIHIPFLAVFGSDDKATTIEQNFIPMYHALSKAGNKNYKLIVLADEDHFFLRYQDKQMEKHQFGEMKVSGRLLNTFMDWFRSNNIL